MMKWIVAAVATITAMAAGAWWYSDYRIRAALLAQPVYRVIEAHHPALFDELLADYRRFRRDDMSRAQFINAANAGISEAATRALARASRGSVLALVEDMVATARTLQAVPGDACFRFWFPDVAGAPDVATHLDAQSQAKTFDLMAEVIRSAAEEPAPPLDVQSVQEDLAGVVNGVYEEFGVDAQMLAHAADPRADRSRVCAITISLYERILRLPPAAASDVIRAMAPSDTGSGPDS